MSVEYRVSEGHQPMVAELGSFAYSQNVELNCTELYKRQEKS